MRILAELVRSGEGRAGTIVLALFVLLAATAPWLFPGDPLAINARPLILPFTDIGHVLGTDRLGRDLLAELAWGARTTLLVALSSALAALVAGTAVGTVAGFLGGWTDDVLMRVSDAFQTVPAFLLALALVSVAGPTLPAIVLSIAAGAWPQPARIARAQIRSLRERDFVAAARVVGMHPVAIAFREVLPNALTPVISLAAIIAAAAVLIEASLSFLGFGDPNHASWGAMVAEGRAMLRSAPSLSLVPGLALVLVVLAIHLLGRGYARALRVREPVA
ncbi:ABC transporter permease [Labrys monachus]|uniref:Peptide/nickel transport system permease protein n=1 Tax=Labrys monachus TaxID=217067 RepID=A0ABU0F9I3_9HYPH|nr:ABC transporter permease [Labrys monachus]MDQ0391271.1 peptide/nickel transport system permease protein [Labrys monachus]